MTRGLVLEPRFVCLWVGWYRTGTATKVDRDTFTRNLTFVGSPRGLLSEKDLSFPKKVSEPLGKRFNGKGERVPLQSDKISG